MSDTAALIADLVALRTGYKAAGRMLEVRAVDRCIAIARQRKTDPPDRATRPDQHPSAQGSGVDPDSWLIGRFNRSV